MAGLELHEACTMGDCDTLKECLISRKFDVNMRDAEWQNRTALHWACSKGYVECLRLLLTYGAKGTARMNMGWTPAHCAAEAGKIHVLRALQGSGVSVCKKDKYGDTPAQVAQTYGHWDCVKFLQQVEEEIAEQKKLRKSGGDIEETDSEDDYQSDEDFDFSGS